MFTGYNYEKVGFCNFIASFEMGILLIKQKLSGLWECLGNSMRIANVIEEGKLGGPQIRMVRIAAALSEQVETIIIMPRSNSKLFTEMCLEYGVPYRLMRITRITAEFREAVSYVVFTPLEVLALIRLFRRERIEAVHASGGSWQYKGVIAAWMANIPVIWHLNDTDMPRWVRLLFRVFKPFADGFIIASHRTANYYGAKLDGNLCGVVPSTVDLEKFSPTNSYSSDDPVFEMLGKSPVVGTVANINFVKGFEILINAFAKARQTVPNLRLVVVGPVHKNQAGYFKKLCAIAERLDVAQAIEWVGGRTDVRPFLSRMDVYLCSSLSESSPVSVWEAMAMALPIVSTDVGDVPLHVTHGKQGFVVPVGDSDAIAGHICDLIKDPAMRLRMGQAAREAAIIFSPPIIAKMTLNIYQRVIQSRG